MDGRVMRCGITSSCQSAASYEIVKRCKALYKQRYTTRRLSFFQTDFGEERSIVAENRQRISQICMGIISKIPYVRNGYAVKTRSRKVQTAIF